MELIRINDKKIKIMLTPSDMKAYELDVQKLSCGMEESRRAFRHMLHDAGIGREDETETDKIFVQYYPSKGGGCEMFITKLELAEGGQTLNEKEKISVGDKDKKETERSLAYRFDTLAQLLLGCRYLCAVLHEMAHVKSVSEAYQGDEGFFYLIVRMMRQEQLTKRCTYLLGEVGTQILPPSSARAYIIEHGRPLCSHRAIETLGKL